ncbi:MAG: hypothetical protein WCT31_05590, partial [Candidatus Micrarchaeia archaeon]
MHLAVARPEPHLRVARFSKQLFETSFGPKVEYLLIPKLSDKLHDVCVPAGLDKRARTIVFFDGWMLRLSQWNMQTPAFTIPNGLPGFQDYNLVFMNNLGHGKSEIGKLAIPGEINEGI